MDDDKAVRERAYDAASQILVELIKKFHPAEAELVLLMALAGAGAGAADNRDLTAAEVFEKRINHPLAREIYATAFDGFRDVLERHFDVEKKTPGSSGGASRN